MRGSWWPDGFPDPSLPHFASDTRTAPRANSSRLQSRLRCPSTTRSNFPRQQFLDHGGSNSGLGTVRERDAAPRHGYLRRCMLGFHLTLCAYGIPARPISPDRKGNEQEVENYKGGHISLAAYPESVTMQSFA